MKQHVSAYSEAIFRFTMLALRTRKFLVVKLKIRVFGNCIFLMLHLVIQIITVAL